jgi:hypothetical protein
MLDGGGEREESNTERDGLGGHGKIPAPKQTKVIHRPRHNERINHLVQVLCHDLVGGSVFPATFFTTNYND